MTTKTKAAQEVRIDQIAKGEWLVWRSNHGIRETLGHCVRRLDVGLVCDCYDVQPCSHMRLVYREEQRAAGQLELRFVS